jgi:hypothetical protein
MTMKERLGASLGSYGLGFHEYFCCVEKKLRVNGENGRCFRLVFQNMEILVDDISNFEIERMII